MNPLKIFEKILRIGLSSWSIPVLSIKTVEKEKAVVTIH